MPTLPAHHNLDQLRHQAKDLLRAANGGDSHALAQIQAVSDQHTLASAQLAIDRAYGFASWPKLKAEVETRTVDLAEKVDAFCTASIRDGSGRAAALLAATPEIAGYNFATAVILGDPVRVDQARGQRLTSATEAIADVCGLRGVDHSNDLQLDPRRQQIEQSAPATEQHRDLVDLELIEHTRFERRLRRIRAVDEDIAVTGGSLRLRHRADDPVGHIRDQRILHDRRPRRAVTGHEDRDALVVITAPVIDLFNGIATGQDRAGRFAFVEKLFAYPQRLRVRTSVRSKPVPLMQPHEVIAARVGRFVVRPSDVPVNRHRHVEH